MPLDSVLMRQAQQGVRIGNTLVPTNTLFLTHFLSMHACLSIGVPVQETQRLMPVVPLVVRQAQQDVKIGDTLVPKNTLFITHFLAMHTSDRYWERPLDFIPVSAAMLCLASR